MATATLRRVLILFLVSLFTLVVLPAGEAQAQGLLIPKRDGAAPLRQTLQTVRFEVTDDIAVAHVTHEFRNESDATLEAVYYFSLPKGATTTDFAMWIGGERVKGEVLPRERARAIYDSIVSNLRDPALLETADGELFTASVYPIAPRSVQRIEVEFALPNQRRNGLIQLGYPISRSTLGAAERLVFDAEIQSRAEVTSVQTPYDEATKRVDGRRATVHLERAREQREDIVLLVGTAGDELGLSIMTFDPDGQGGEKGYFMATLSASSELVEAGALDRQMTIVIDRSGSMSGAKMAQAKEMLRSTIGSLGANDTFNLISFSQDADALFSAPRKATSDNREDALRFVERMVADGDTNIESALRLALEQPTRGGRPHAIVFVTDGIPTRGERDIDALLRLVKRGTGDRGESEAAHSRMFSFGVGYDVNTKLLDGIARTGDGESGYVRPQEDISDVVGSFVAGLASPIATELTLDFGDEVTDLHPRMLPDLYPGRPITVFGRFSSAMSQEVKLRGQGRNGTLRTSFGAEFGSSSDAINASFVGNLWASRHCADLLETIRIEGESAARKREITEVATRWGIVTPYTSFLVVPEGEETEREDEPSEPEIDPTPLRRIHHEIPMGGLRNEEEKSALGMPSREQVRPKAAQRSMATADVGKDAVEASIERNRSRNSLRAETSTSARFASGRTFSLLNGVWTEHGIERRSADRRIVAWSSDYFALLRNHPELREALALGEQVRFRIGNEIIEVSAR